MPGTTATSPHHIELEFSVLADVFKRGAHTLIAVRAPDSKIILGCKKQYPPGIVRLPGGGIEAGENSLEGAVRELSEELNIQVQTSDLKEIAAWEFHITEVSTKQRFTFKEFLYISTSVHESYSFQSDLDEIVLYSRDELQALVTRYLDLAESSTEESIWKSYGVIMSQVHQAVVDALDTHQR